MSDITLDQISIQVEGNSDKAIESLNKLVETIDNLTKSTSKGFFGLEKTNKKIQEITNTAKKNTQKLNTDVKKNIGGIVKEMAKIGFATMGIGESIKQAVQYTASISQFNSTLNTNKEILEDATDFVYKLTDAWYLNEQEVMSAMSRYYSMTNTMGISSKDALRMSKNLTMLTQDLAAWKQVDTAEVMNQIASGLRGEAEGLSKFGISLNQATLQSVLYANGIDRTVSSLNAAQKAELIYYQIMKQTQEKQGYLTKTLLEPANALKTVKTLFINLARALGSVFIPILQAAAPYIMLITNLLNKLARALASLLGFELGDWGDSTEQISSGISDIGDSAESTSKKVKGMLADFDELHTINFSDAGGSGDNVGAGGSLGLDASQFEYADIINEKLKEVQDKISKIKDYVIAIGIALAGYKVSKLILDFFANLFKLGENVKKSLLDIAIGFGLIAGGSYLVIDAIFDISQNGLTLQNTLQLLIGSLAILIGSYEILKGLKAIGLYEKIFGKMDIVKAATSVGTAILGLIIFVSAFSIVLEKGSEATGMLQLAFAGLGLAMIGVTIAGAPIVAVVVGIAAGIYMLIGYIVELRSRIQNLKDPTVEIVDAWDWMSDGVKKLGDTIGGVTGSIGGNFSNLSTNAQESFNSINSDAENTKNNIDKYLGQDVANSLTNSTINFENYQSDLQTILENSDMTVSEKMNAIQQTISSQSVTATTNLTENFNSAEKTIDTTSTNIENSITGSMDEVSKKVDNTTSNIDTKTSSWKSMFERANEANIKTPSFAWKEAVSSGLNLALKTVLATLNLPIALPQMTVSWFEDGGFPTKGDLFFANENGKPEWVSTMNGRTAVANNDQITTGVRQATYEGMSQALAEYSGGGTTIYNYLDSKEIASKMTRVKKSNDNMYG